MSQLLNNKAQAATELAVFGAILIFVIGGIIRNSIQAGLDQNQSLKAMRWALSQSLKGVRNANKSRDNANLLVIEDRLSPDEGKFGSLERVPMVQAGSGTFSNTIFMPLDWNEDRNIPVMDVFINGDHFVFTTGRFLVYDVQPDPANAASCVNPATRTGACRIRIMDLTNRITRYVPQIENANWLSTCIPPVPPSTTSIGCPIFFSIIPANSADFCKDDLTCDNSVATFNQRFDLNLNFNYTDDPPLTARQNMMWQWKPLKGLKDNFKIDADNGVYVSFDIDYDRREETVYWVNGGNNLAWPAINNAQVAQRFGVLDSQAGDVNMTLDDTDRANGLVGTDIGLQKDVSVYTLTNDGTYLQIRQGKAFNPENGNFIRSVNKKDQVDVISRMFQLSNNTGRYCPAASVCGTPPATIGTTTEANPVEACVNSNPSSGPRCDCFSNITVSETCFDAASNMLYVRSRIHENRGRKWVTQMEQ